MQLSQIRLSTSPECLWTYLSADPGADLSFEPPVLELNNASINAWVITWSSFSERVVFGSIIEATATGTLGDDPNLLLELTLRFSGECPVVRFRYSFHSKLSRLLSKLNGADHLEYMTVDCSALSSLMEVRVSEFNELVHSYSLVERTLQDSAFESNLAVMGPIIAGQSATHSFLLAYEHGSQSPDAFLEFRLNKDKRVGLHAVKGNYASSTEICPGRPFETIWLQAAIVQGDNAALAEAYRDFVLRWQTSNRESRQPYIFYNTWNYQERLHHWNKRPYLSEMTEERMLAEIDAAHSMGIDVFVIDTGWYDSTGDWRVSRSRFPDGLASVRARLESCGMKLGLWFNPTAAALSSAMRQNHEDCLMTQNAKPSDPAEVWETEASQAMCLVSRYADAFTQELIRLVREVGVTYFKWDAIGQYGCDDPGHYHGSHENTQEERRDCYAFELPKVMTRIVDNLCAACPEAIVDFDVTEGGRAVGLAFLSAGKYFLINNGPYSSNYDMPIPTDGNPNLFFYPGPARAWICRTPLTFDKWLPSVLFLSHYLPDDRYINHDWQGSGETLLTDKNLWICLASLVLGQNGIWGDLPAISDGGKAKFGEALSRYKLVRNDITSAALVKTGDVGGSPEVYEKIDRSSGRGVVSIFASAAGKYTYISQAPAATDNWHNDGVAVAYDSRRRAVITMNFASSGAKLIFFGVSN